MTTVSRRSAHPSRRGRARRGDGGVTQRADGRWVARIELGLVDGVRKRKELYGATRDEVLTKLEEARSQQRRGLRLTTDRDSWGVFLDRWYATLRPRPQGRYSPTTLKHYGDIIRNHLSPQLGRLQVSALNADHVQDLQDDLLARGYAGQTVLNVRNLLRKAVRHAMQRRLLTYNPVDMVEPPEGSRGTGQVIDRDAARAFHDGIKGHRFEAAFLLEFVLAMRRSEVLGLSWDALDLDHEPAAIHVRQGLHRVKGQGLLLLQPKSKRGNRRLVLPRRVAAALRARRDAQLLEEIAAAEHWQNHERRLVFTTFKGTPFEPSHFTNEVKNALRVAGAGHLRGHDLRHSMSSELQSGGLSPLGTMTVLGHASPDMTMGIYGHLVDADRRAAARIMDGYLAELDEPSGAAG